MIHLDLNAKYIYSRKGKAAIRLFFLPLVALHPAVVVVVVDDELLLVWTL